MAIAFVILVKSVVLVSVVLVFECSFDVSLRLEMLLCSGKRFYASLDKSVLQGILFSD